MTGPLILMFLPVAPLAVALCIGHRRRSRAELERRARSPQRDQLLLALVRTRTKEGP